jgi:hypothetical protein
MTATDAATAAVEAAGVSEDIVTGHAVVFTVNRPLNRRRPSARTGW